MKYLAVLGRQPEISIAELEALFTDVQQVSDNLSIISLREAPEICNFSINRLGGTLKLATKLEIKPLDYLKNLPAGKITLGISDYTNNASRKSAQNEALKLKKILVRLGRSVRVVENREPTLSTATSLHNGLSGKNERKIELIKTEQGWYRVIGVQDIDAYTRRDQKRPARDAKVGMLPPKLAQILINLCGPLKPGSTILDPFCGTGVVLQEALLMGYRAYGTDISERMVEYTKRNTEWLLSERGDQRGACSSEPRNDRATEREKSKLACFSEPGSLVSQDGREREREESNQFQISKGDATSFQWQPPINAVAAEGYLGKPFSKIPTDIELKEQQQECQAIILGFLKNLASQIKPGTPVVIAIPAWLRPDGTYKRLEILAFLDKLGYNVNNKSREGLIYHRESQIVARDIIILRKK